MIAYLTLFIFVAPIIAGIFLLKRSKKLAYGLLSIPLIAIFIVIGFWIYQVNHHFVSSTPLAGEKIGDISLLEPLDDSLKEELGSYRENDNVFFKESLEFDKVTIGTNENNEIVYISTRSDATMTTDKGIQLGDSIQKVFDTYGKNYYTYREMGLGQSINYVDRKNKIHIQFWHDEDKVSGIKLMEM